jgi:T4 RnlA family RNA ligase
MRGVGVVFSRFLEVDIVTGVVIGMGIVFFYTVLGGMKGITYTQVAQYCVLIFAYLVPAVFISMMVTGHILPQTGFGATLSDGSGVFLLEKLDGSMIAPFLSDKLEGVYWASMRGSYDYHIRLSGLYSGTEYARLVHDLAKDQLTAIFEFCSQENRIVVDYPEPQMTLLAIRHMHTGRYHTRNELETIASEFNVPLVQPLPHRSNATADLMDELANIKNLEGAVLWKNGRPLAKFKGVWYLQLHKLLGHFKFEKDIARLVLSGNTDDLMGILNSQKREALTQYKDALLTGIKQIASDCEALRDDVVNQNIDRKTFAVNHPAPQSIKAYLFRHFDALENAEFFEDVLAKALSKTGSFGKWEGFKSSMGMNLTWDVDHLG